MTRRALFVGNFFSVANHHHYCEDLTNRLEQRGWEIVRTSRQIARTARLVDMLSVTWRERAAYDVAHVDVFSGAAFVWAEAVCFELARLHKPLVLTLRGGNLPAFARRWPRRTRRLLRSAHTVVAPSPYLGNALADHGVRITLVPNAVDVTRHTAPRRTGPRTRLVWLRAFHSIYNPVLAIDVLAKLPARFTLTMFGIDKGDGSLEATRRRVKERGVQDRVQIVLGIPKSEVPRALDAADIFLNTTNVDNTPVSVVEAMASGLGIVSTNAGGIPDLLRDGVDALLVRPEAADAMVQAIERLAGDDALATRLSNAARSTAESFDWGPVLARWDELLREAAHG